MSVAHVKMKTIVPAEPMIKIRLGGTESHRCGACSYNAEVGETGKIVLGSDVNFQCGLSTRPTASLIMTQEVRRMSHIIKSVVLISRIPTLLAINVCGFAGVGQFRPLSYFQVS